MNPSSVPRHAWRLFWAGLAGAAFVALFGILGPHSGSIWGVQNQLKARVEGALARTPARHVAVEMDGQTVRLVGEAPSQEARDAAIYAARSTGGVTQVISEDLIIGAHMRPYFWGAALRGRRLTLTGYMQSTGLKRRLRGRAREMFAGSEIVDATRIAFDVPDGAWARAAEDALSQLAKLREGEARLTETHLVILGEGDARAVNEVRAHYRGRQSAPYRTRLEIEVAGEDLGIADLGDLDLARPSAATCQAAFDRMMARNVINFQATEIDRASLRLIDQLASIALRCDSYRIEIAGHTDNVGDRNANLTLSQRRAQAVADSLAGQGVRRDRLRAVGYGPDQPRAGNETPVGQAANRRIEFTVSS